MTASRDALKTRMTAAAASRSGPAAKPAGRTALRSQPVRITLNLPPELARQLMRWTDQAAESIDAPRVGVQDALRAMVRVITDESAPNASMKVLGLLREGRA